MTVAAQTPLISYVENGVTTAFAVPFRYNAPTDLMAVRRDADGVDTALTYGTDFTATSGITDLGGTLTVAAAAVSGTRLLITRVTARQQTADYITNGAFSAESHERALDQAMLVNQEQDVLIGRAIKAALGETAPTLAPVATLEGRTLFFENGMIKGGETDLPALEATVTAARDDAEAARDAAVAAQGDAEAARDTAVTAADTATAQASAAAGSASAADADAATATTKAAEAAASAASAVLAPGSSATSTTSVTIGTGAKAFTIQTGKQFAIGQFVIAARTSAPENWMFGQVSAHNSGTGALTIAVEDTNGSGTFTDWTIALSGPSGSVGMIDLLADTIGTLTVARGGSGSPTADGALANFGATTVGAALFKLANPSAVRYLRLNADNTVTALSAADLLAALGIGTIASQAANNVALTGGSISGMSSIADSLGNVRRLIKAARTSGTLTAADANQRIRATGNLTIPSAVFAANDTVMIQNKSGGNITITQGSGLTLTDSEGNTGTRTLANHGVVTVLFDSASVADIFGTGLS